MANNQSFDTYNTLNDIRVISGETHLRNDNFKTLQDLNFNN